MLLLRFYGVLLDKNSAARLVSQSKGRGESCICTGTGVSDPLALFQSKYPKVYKCGVRFMFHCSCQSLAYWIAH